MMSYTANVFQEKLAKETMGRAYRLRLPVLSVDPCWPAVAAGLTGRQDVKSWEVRVASSPQPLSSDASDTVAWGACQPCQKK